MNTQPDNPTNTTIPLRFNEQGLVPVIAQDAETGEVLMMAWANAEAVRLTISTGNAHYYSRSRQKLWKKGEESGHTQQVKEILVDCDEDTLLYKVLQTGAACHTGYKSCFHRTLDGRVTQKQLVRPEDVYTK